MLQVTEAKEERGFVLKNTLGLDRTRRRIDETLGMLLLKMTWHF